MSYKIVFKLNFLLLLLSGITVLNYILLLITQSHSSTPQASSSIKHFDTHTFTYNTPIFIIEVLTHTHTCSITDIMDKSNFKKPSV